MSGFKRWYKITNFQVGDDIIFKCRDLNNQEFEIFRLPFQKRNEQKILHQNERLGKIIYDMLKYSVNKYNEPIFSLRHKNLRLLQNKYMILI